MSDTKGEFHADIPADAIEEALRSVEKNRRPEEEGEEVLLDTAASDDEDGDEAEVEVEVPAEAGEVRKLRAMLEDSAERARQTQERLKDTHERFVRVTADFDNYRKRAAKEREETVKLANERLLKELLPVVDNLERAIQAGGADGEGLLAGVRMVHKQFLEVLGRSGVKQFSALGEPFDPNVHDALMQQESADVPAGTVLTEMLKGYFLNERLVRPAAVVVAKAPEQTDSQEGGEAPAE